MLNRPHLMMVLSFLSILIITLVLGISFYRSSVSAAKEAVQLELSAIARSATTIITAKDVYNLFVRKANQLSPELYYRYLKRASKLKSFHRLKKKLSNLIKAHKNLNFNENNIYIFSVDPYDSENLRWALMNHRKPFSGERYKVREEMKPLLKLEKKFGNTDIYTSLATKKRWISAYALLKYKNKAVGIIEVALQVEGYYKKINKRIYKVLLINFLMLISALILMFLVFRLIKTITKRNKYLILEQEKTRLSEEQYKNLTESSDEIIISVDHNGHILSVNKAIKKHLMISAEDIRNQVVFDVLFDRDDEIQKGDRDIFVANWRSFLKDRSTLAVTLSLYHKITREPKEFQFRFQDNNRNVLITAAFRLEDILSERTLAEKATYKLENYLTMAESLAQKITFSLSRYVSSEVVYEVKVAIRELIINAMEHGNLNISFEEKTQAQLEDNYLELIEQRRLEKNYKDRKVMVEYLINAKTLAIRISDEGQGFDHKNYLKNSMDDTNDTVLSHGRGISFALEVFDSLTYNALGNSVSLIKKLN